MKNFVSLNNLPMDSIHWPTLAIMAGVSFLYLNHIQQEMKYLTIALLALTVN